jgi:hypothetical protein
MLRTTLRWFSGSDLIISDYKPYTIGPTIGRTIGRTFISGCKYPGFCQRFCRKFSSVPWSILTFRSAHPTHQRCPLPRTVPFRTFKTVVFFWVEGRRRAWWARGLVCVLCAEILLFGALKGRVDLNCLVSTSQASRRSIPESSSRVINALAVGDKVGSRQSCFRIGFGHNISHLRDTRGRSLCEVLKPQIQQQCLSALKH